MAGLVLVHELDKVLKTLSEAVKFAEDVKANEMKFKIARDACIQRFEYSIELSWKIAMKVLGSQTKFPKQAVREMARGGLIDSAEEWLDFIEARNDSSHSYDEVVAQKVYAQILKFGVRADDLLTRLRNIP
jgi:nucleotidyltransferase substrate binding protein (TIGR01987 family)